MQVIIGDTTLAISNDTTRFIRGVAEIKQHPKFGTKGISYDIAILVLSKPVDLQKYPNIKPACLPFCTRSSDPDFAGKTAIISGWGRSGWGKPTSSHLNEVEVEVFKKTNCGEFTNKITPDMVCAGELSGGKSGCNGDSGGPLVIEDADNNGYYSLLGVVSWGNRDCGKANSPTVFADVPYFMQDGWLQSQLTNLITCPPAGNKVTRPDCNSG